MFILLQETLIIKGHHINNARILKTYSITVNQKEKRMDFKTTVFGLYPVKRFFK